MKNIPIYSSLLAWLAAPALLTQVALADYQSTVQSDAPKAFYRLNDNTSRTLINKNSGTLGAVADATNDLSSDGALHPFAGAIVGEANAAAFFDFSTRTEIPFNAALNPPNTQPFTIEAWLYPASDQTANGQSPLANRWTLSSDRLGWVFFQRKPSADYFGSEPVGWNCRMYNGNGGSGRLEVTSLVPYRVGEWQHVVVVYDPVQVTNATLTMYINGVPANTNIWTGGASGTEPGYAPVRGDLSPQPAMALGNYNNANSGLNPYFGGVDEFALYPTKLSDAQILSHYQNATNANRAQSYSALIKSHNPGAYLRLDDMPPGPDVAINLGDVRKAGLATHTSEVRHPAPSALAGGTELRGDGSAAYHNRNGRATTTMPFHTLNNPNAGIPFTFEAWLRPMRDSNGGQAPVNNRWPKLGHRTGWVIFQRTPNLTYNQGAGEGHGWNFRMYNGANGSGSDVTTDTDFEIGKWQHLVVTWEPQFQNGDVGGFGNDQWQGTLTAYINGVMVAQNASALYAANREVPEDGGVPADFAVGAYNAASTLGDNPFEGDIDEVAFYNFYALTPQQILEHYQTGTNAHPATSYSSQVMTAAFFGPERLGLPATYLRFNEPAPYAMTNGGTLGSAARGNLVLTTNSAAGPRSPAYAGFSSTNTALPLDGAKQWASFNNPTGLNITGQITLEAWIKPAASQFNDPARIISHGPQTLTSFPFAELRDAVTNTTEVFLAISGGNYVVGSREGIDNVATNTYSASFPIPGGDQGGSAWVHLVGTYDGANWRLFRNGAQVASAAGPVGALAVTNADWAIGSTGNGWEANYAGDVDEVAIYSNTLTPAQIANHYVIGKAGTTALTVARAAANSVTITWPTGTILQEATAVGGPYTARSGNPTSPLTIPATGTMFYRWALQ